MTTTDDAGDGWRTGDTYYYRTAADQSLSEAVVRAVATVSKRNPVGADPDGSAEPLDPLYRTIDPDALDALFRDAGDERRTGTVAFPYCGYEVTVDDAGLVTVAEG